MENLVILHKLQSHGFEYIRRNKRLKHDFQPEKSQFSDANKSLPDIFRALDLEHNKELEQHKGDKKCPLAIRHSKSLPVVCVS